MKKLFLLLTIATFVLAGCGKTSKQTEKAEESKCCKTEESKCCKAAADSTLVGDSIIVVEEVVEIPAE